MIKKKNDNNTSIYVQYNVKKEKKKDNNIRIVLLTP